MISCVDVDNTLFDFSPPCYKEVSAYNKDLPTPDKWNKWEVFSAYVKKEDLHRAFDCVHMSQCDFPPYDGTRELLQYLHTKGPICIASNRCLESYDALRDWLEMHRLPYDQIYVSYDKTKLFDYMKVGLIVDDNPHTLKKAEELGIKAVGLEYPWNKGMGLTLFENLENMLDYLRKIYG